MKRLMLSLLLTLGAGFLALFQQGCGNIRWTVVAAPTPTPSLPNAARIEARMGDQHNRITNAVQTGNLDQSVAEGLVQNIDNVQQWEMAYLQAKNSPYRDLSAAETRWLDRMLDDNALAIDDAIARNQAWMRLFQGGSVYHYNFNTAAEQRQFIVYLHFRIREQHRFINEYERLGRLSGEQCRILRRRVDAVGELEKSYYRKNGKMVFSKSQIRQMKAGLERNTREFDQLKVKYGNPNPAPTPTAVARLENFQKDHWNKKWKKDGQDSKVVPPAPTPTPTSTSVPPPAPKPTETTVPQVQNETDPKDRKEHSDNRYGEKHQKGFSNSDKDNRYGDKHEKGFPKDGGEKQDSGKEIPAATPLSESPAKQPENQPVENREGSKEKSGASLAATASPEDLDTFEARLKSLSERIQKALQAKSLKLKERAALSRKQTALTSLSSKFNREKNKKGGLSQSQLDQMNKAADEIQKGLPEEPKE